MESIEAFCKRNVGTFFSLFLINAIALTYFGNDLKQYTDLPKLDFMLGGYTRQTIVALIAAYGAKGLKTYYLLTMLDMPFPFLVFGFAVGYAVSHLRIWHYKRAATLVLIAAGSILFFDLVENMTIFVLFEKGTEWVGDTWIVISSMATQIKLVSLAFVYTTLLIVWIGTMILKRKETKQLD